MSIESRDLDFKRERVGIVYRRLVRGQRRFARLCPYATLWRLTTRELYLYICRCHKSLEVTHIVRIKQRYHAT